MATASMSQLCESLFGRAAYSVGHAQDKIIYKVPSNIKSS